MSRFATITLREVESSDLEAFFEHQLDPEAIKMAAFVCEDPMDRLAFHAHWNQILNSSQIKCCRNAVLKSSEQTKISPMAEAKKPKNTFFAWIS